MRDITKLKILSLAITVIGGSILFGGSLYWMHVDKENSTPSYIAGINLSKSESDFRFTILNDSSLLIFCGLSMFSVFVFGDKLINEFLKDENHSE